MAQWFWSRFSKVVNIFFHFVAIIYASKKRKALHFKETKSPLPKDFFVPSLVEISPIVLEKFKIYENKYGWTL